MPHGLTIDRMGNIWVTDVGLHQVQYDKIALEHNTLPKLSYEIIG